MIINLKSIVDWIVTATRKKREVNIYNVRKNSRQVKHDNEHIYLVYVDKAVIYFKPDYKQHLMYRITELFTKCIVLV